MQPLQSNQWENGEYPDSYYASSTAPAPLRPSLNASLDTDICVVGGGYTGLSTALFLQEMGYQVSLLEGGRVGWGASGRNGGQVINGLKGGFEAYERLPGSDRDTASSLAMAGRNIIMERLERYTIDCDLQHGMLTAAQGKRAMRELHQEAEQWRQRGIELELLDRESLRGHLGSDAFLGGLRDPAGAHLHPLKLALGEARALESLGGRIFEHSPAVSVHLEGDRPRVTTPDGEVRCRKLVLACNAYLARLQPTLARRILPTGTQMIATEPLAPELARELLPSNHCVCDRRYVLEYFRLSADNRLLYGGGVTYGGRSPSDIEAYIRPRMERTFPQLKSVAVEFSWTGNIAITARRLPEIGRLDPATYFAHGYSGFGVTVSHLYSQALANAINGDHKLFDLLSQIRAVPMPGGSTLRTPVQVAGSWWYRLKDALDV